MGNGTATHKWQVSVMEDSGVYMLCSLMTAVTKHQQFAGNVPSSNVPHFPISHLSYPFPCSYFLSDPASCGSTKNIPQGFSTSATLRCTMKCTLQTHSRIQRTNRTHFNVFTCSLPSSLLPCRTIRVSDQTGNEASFRIQITMRAFCACVTVSRRLAQDLKQEALEFRVLLFPFS